MPEETNQDKTRNAYAALGSRMKRRLQTSEEKAQETRQEGFGRIDKEKLPSFIPEEFIFRILGLKRQTDLPETVLPSTYFEKKGRRGPFLRRLAADVLEFGRSYQRAYSTLPEHKQLAEAFLKQRSHWECDEKDIADAIKGLQKGGLVGTKGGQLLFEPLTISRDITSLLQKVWQQRKEFWEANQLASILGWDKEKTHEVLKTLTNEQICVKDKEGYWFTGFSS